MSNIYLIRHAESEANVDYNVNRTTANHNVKLTEKGYQQAKECGQFLYNQLGNGIIYGRVLDFFVSPYLRAKETARVIQSEITNKCYQIKLREFPNLVEQQFGLFDGLSEEERKEKFLHNHNTHQQQGIFFGKYPQGESQFDVYLRIQSILPLLLKGENDKVVISHGIVANLLTMLLMNYSFQWMEESKNPPNASIRLIKDYSPNDFLDCGLIFPGFPKKVK